MYKHDPLCMAANESQNIVTERASVAQIAVVHKFVIVTFCTN